MVQTPHRGLAPALVRTVVDVSVVAGGWSLGHFSLFFRPVQYMEETTQLRPTTGGDPQAMALPRQTLYTTRLVGRDTGPFFSVVLPTRLQRWHFTCAAETTAGTADRRCNAATAADVGTAAGITVVAPIFTATASSTTPAIAAAVFLLRRPPGASTCGIRRLPEGSRALVLVGLSRSFFPAPEATVLPYYCSTV